MESVDINRKSVSRSGVYVVEFTSTIYGSTQKKTRPAIIISNDIGNTNSSICLVIPLTTKTKKPLPTHVIVNGKNCYGTALCEQITCMDQSVILERLEVLDDNIMEKIEKACVISLGIKCSTKGNRIFDKYIESIEETVRKKDLEFDTSGYLVKNKILRVPVIDKNDSLLEENIRLKTELEIYKNLYTKMFETILNKSS